MDDVKRNKRAIVTLCFGTVAIISDIYVAQPILPLLSTSFGVSHTVASLAVSLNILALSLALLVYGPVSDYAGRKPVMVTTGFLLVIPTLSIAFTNNFTIFLVLRTVQGLFVAGIAAIAMAYINEEFPSAIMGRMMGFYVSSMVASGFLGRVLSGVLAGLFNWRITFIIFGILNLLGSWSMFHFLPESRHFKRSSGLLKACLEMLKHFKNRRLVGAFVIAFTLFFTFTGAFTYVTFYLSAPPFNLSTVALGLIFTVYIAGALSPVAGSLSERLGRRTVMGAGLMIAALGVSLTIAHSLAVIVAGLLLLCAGLFSTQPAAGSFVGDNAKSSKGSATSLYLFSYYIGGSAGAFLPGFLWNAYGWPGVLAACFISVAIAFLSLATLCR